MAKKQEIIITDLIQEKIDILEKNLKHKYKDVTDFDYSQISKTFVLNNGWTESMTLTEVIIDCAKFMAVRLAYGMNR